MKLVYGDRAAREVSGRVAAPVATLTELKSIPADRREAGMHVLVTADGSRWRFHATSTLTGDDVLVATPSAGSGRWLRQTGGVLLALPFTFATADAAVLLTLPAGCLMQMGEPAWRVTGDFTGGAASAIGVSSSVKSGFTTKGDLLGGATGDVAATLVASSGLSATGTVGTQNDTLAKRRAMWKPADTFRFDRITSAFTAGSGSVLLACNLLQHDGA